MSTIKILEHTSSSYGPRTYANAAKADITIAIAVDYTTAGERLTHKAAGDKYLKLDPALPAVENARVLWRRVNNLGDCFPAILNVAGNGIYTLSKHGWTQARMDCYVYDVLEPIIDHCELGKIISGGQTGVDISGAWAAHKLGIDVEVLLPKGLIQRFEDGKDVSMTEEEIYKQIVGE